MRQIDGNTPNNEFGLLFLSEGANAEIYYLSDQEKTKGESKVLKRLKTDYPIYNFYRANLATKSLTLSKIEPVPTSVNSYFQEGPGSYHPATDRFYFSRSAQRFDKKHGTVEQLRDKKSEINSNRDAQPLPFNVEEALPFIRVYRLAGRNYFLPVTVPEDMVVWIYIT